MAEISAGDTRKNFSELTGRVAYGRERIVVTRKGKPFVGVVPLEDLKVLELIEEQIDLEDFQAALEEWQKDGARRISWEAIKAEAGLA